MAVFSQAFRGLLKVYSNKELFLLILFLSFVYTLFIYFLFVNFLNDYLSYFSLGALIIKTKGLQSLSSLYPYFLASPIVTILSFVSPALLNVYFAFLAIKEEFRRRINEKELKERTKKGMLFFILFFFLLSFISSLLSPLLIFNPALYSLLIILLFYSTFFSPYALVIDDYNFVQAIKKSFSLVKKKPLFPLIWALFIIIALSILFLVVDIVSKILWPSGIIVDRITFNELFIFFINQVLIIPYSIILASYFYIMRYPLVNV